VLNKIKPPYNVNQLTQDRALERLQNLQVVKKEVTSILREREQLNQALSEIDFITEVFDSDANFILARVDNANKRYKELISKGIVVRNRTTQALCENCLRFTVGTADENKRLIQVLKELQ
jgi:histidinol-phosphate aminotransferase